jgi:hypothetical protein
VSEPPDRVQASPDATTRAERLKQIALDLLALPAVALAPRRPFVDGGGEAIDLQYGPLRHYYWRSERSLEIPLARRAMAGRPPSSILEVGNVLGNVGIRGHVVVDKYEVAPGVLNVDVLDYEPEQPFDLALSISTLEHVGWDEVPRDPERAVKALAVMGELGRDLLVTIPVGYHRPLEQAFADGPFDTVTLAVRTSRVPRWEVRPLADLPSIRFGTPFACGNGLLIGSRTTAAA